MNQTTRGKDENGKIFSWIFFEEATLPGKTQNKGVTSTIELLDDEYSLDHRTTMSEVQISTYVQAGSRIIRFGNLTQVQVGKVPNKGTQQEYYTNNEQMTSALKESCHVFIF